jgi:serine/threonine protein phosphatase PrpC
MKLEVSSLTDIGKVRPNNEDAVGRFEPKTPNEQVATGWLFVVADGMGGHRGGEIASKIAVDGTQSSYRADLNEDRAAALKSAVEHANRLILNESASDEALMGMGTTCTAMAVHESYAYFVHVGDSRAYVLRDGELVQITQDHSLVGEMVRSGILSDEDARNHPKRNVITRSLGIQEIINLDTPFSPFELKKDDVFLLCSDGLTSLVNDEEIGGVLSENKPDDACRKLVDAANQEGGRDNITVVVVKIGKL